ncbi:LOW QUALITY PROTEIN: FMN-dependent dehydrogenase [Paramyrothecium foliicola]|nr:LOW QUALITY PROTEIN: FMN-dependent dehydrogenase [Paramyrothecium foliicola]
MGIRENFWKSNDGHTPPFNTHPDELERLAKEKLTQNGWYYASSNAGLSHTHLANRQAFFRHKIVPRQLVDTNERSTKTTIFGHEVSAPFGIAPVGINKIYHPQGELPVAKVAGELGIPYSLSTAGSTSIEDVGRAHDAGRAARTEPDKIPEGPRFFQLYMPHDDELTISLLQRAYDSGFTACILTTDTWQLGWRHDDVATSNYAFYRGIGADLGLTDPVFQKRLAEQGIDPAKQPAEAGALWIDNVWHGRAWSWDKAVWARKKWQEISGGKPFLIKGIQRVEDAEKAADLGFEGIVVSNHAGRQVDGAIGSLDALEKIAESVGDRLVITYDSGVRGAADIVKALALGAKFVFIGRLWIWGLSIMGEHGVRHVLKGLLADLDILMCVAGITDIPSIKRDLLDSQGKAYSLIREKNDGGKFRRNNLEAIESLDLDLVVKEVTSQDLSGQDVGALGQVVDVVHTEQTQADIGASITLSNELAFDINKNKVSILKNLRTLAVGTAEDAPSTAGPRVLGQQHIALELEDALGGIRIGRLRVELNIPNARGAVLRVSGTGLVREALLARGVGADKGNKLGGRDGLVRKQGQQLIDRLEMPREKAVRGRSRVIDAANKGSDARAQWAHNSGNVGGHLDQVGHANPVGLPPVVPNPHLVANSLQTVVAGTGFALSCEDNGSIGASTGTGAERPRAGIVEAKTNGSTSHVGAATCGTDHVVPHLIGNVLPDTACVLATSLGAKLRRRDGAVKVCGVLSRTRAQQNGLDGSSGRREL